MPAGSVCPRRAEAVRQVPAPVACDPRPNAPTGNRARHGEPALAARSAACGHHRTATQGVSRVNPFARAVPGMLILVNGGCIVMHRILAALAASLSLLSPTAIHAQALNACDLNGDGAVNILDVQLATNMVLSLAPCTANVIGAGT